MEIVGKSSLYVEKYRPKTVNDLILPDNVKNFFLKIVEEKEVPTLLFSGGAGVGKSSSAYAIANDLEADLLYVNASMEGIDALRNKVQSFAYTGSFCEGKKIVVLDEIGREGSSVAIQEALKVVIESTESNCRFILSTNNLSKIIVPIKSRCQHVDFNFSPKETKSLMLNYFKRICWILDQEKVVYDKKVLAELTQKLYPDFRKTLNTLQMFVKMYGDINEKIFSTLDDSILNNLIEELKAKKFNAVRKLAVELNPDDFFLNFYNQLDTLVQDSCKPDIILALGEGAYRCANTVSKEIQLVATLIEIMKITVWR